LYKYQIGIPHAQNVLVAAIYLGIEIGFKKIYLMGADHSWHEELIVSKDNIVCFKPKRFSDKEEASLVPFLMHDKSTRAAKMHEIFDAFTKVFVGYHNLEEYSQYRDVKILNASKKTYIDAFERYSP
jgi:hypothetical protein